MQQPSRLSTERESYGCRLSSGSVNELLFDITSRLKALIDGLAPLYEIPVMLVGCTGVSAARGAVCLVSVAGTARFVFFSVAAVGRTHINGKLFSSQLFTSFDIRSKLF